MANNALAKQSSVLSVGQGNRFQAETARVTLPSFRRPNYCKHILQGNDSLGKTPKELFKLWIAAEEDQYLTVGDQTWKVPLYRAVNQALLDDDAVLLKQHAGFIKDLKNALKGHLSQDSFEVYRGIRLRAADIKEYQVGAEFLWPTFSAASKNRAVAEGFLTEDYDHIGADGLSGWVFTIKIEGEKVKQQDKYVYYADLTAVHKSFDEQEQFNEDEVLIFPYTGFRVTHVNHSTHEIHLCAVDTWDVEVQARKTVEQLCPKAVAIRKGDTEIVIAKSGKAAETPVLHGEAAVYNKKTHKADFTSGHWDSPSRFRYADGKNWIERRGSSWFATAVDGPFKTFEIPGVMAA